MQNFIKTIINALQTWTKKEITNSTANWNQNDPTAPDYVKNRTHWEEYENVAIIPETTCVVNEGDLRFLIGEGVLVPNVGQSYTVTLNGAVYECIGRKYDDEYGVLLGNGEIFGDGINVNNEPFSIDSYEDGTIYLNVKVPGEYTIVIRTLQPVIHTIDSKYINIPVQGGSARKSVIVNSEYNEASGDFSLAEGYNTKAEGLSSHTEGFETIASRNYAHAEGSGSIANAVAAHAEGYGTTAGATAAHAEGQDTYAGGSRSHAEGYSTTASGGSSHAEGLSTTASGLYSHAEGYGTAASATAAHAEGYSTTASGAYSHSEGIGTAASGESSHAEGRDTKASD